MTEIELVQMQKRAIRDKMRSERAKLTHKDAVEAGTRILDRILSGSVEGITVSKDSMLGLYVSDKNEPDFSGMLDVLRSKGIRFCFPTVRSGAIRFFSAPSDGKFIPGLLGIPEPGPSAEPIQPADIDIMLVPGMAFDRTGSRLGRGKGMFDQYLARIPEEKRPILVGIGHDFQCLEYIPTEETDISMDYIIVPSFCLRARQALKRSATSPLTVRPHKVDNGIEQYV